MSIWDKYPNFSKDELRTLVAITSQQLLDAGGPGAQLPQDMLRMSSQAAARELAPLLQPGGAVTAVQIQEVLEDEDLSTQVCLKVLDEVRKVPALAEKIAAAYEQSARKMIVPELLLLSGALVVLAIKIKELNWREGKATFYEANDAVKTFVGGLVKGLK